MAGACARMGMSSMCMICMKPGVGLVRACMEHDAPCEAVSGLTMNVPFLDIACQKGMVVA